MLTLGRAVAHHTLMIVVLLCLTLSVLPATDCSGSSDRLTVSNGAISSTQAVLGLDVESTSALLVRASKLPAPHTSCVLADARTAFLTRHEATWSSAQADHPLSLIARHTRLQI